MSERILVHCCCGPCSTSSLQRLIEEGWNPVLYYGNSNIDTEEENNKRFTELQKVADFYKLEVFRDEYNHNEWLNFIKGLENEPEHGKRCSKCFAYNLNQAACKARKLSITHFTTTLTISRFKKSETIFEEGRKFCGFEAIDFKKKDGFAKSVKMSQEMGLYRQQYCGCEFSKQNGKLSVSDSKCNE